MNSWMNSCGGKSVTAWFYISHSQIKSINIKPATSLNAKDNIPNCVHLNRREGCKERVATIQAKRSKDTVA